MNMRSSGISYSCKYFTNYSDISDNSKTRSLTYSTDLENSVSKIFIISLRLSHTVVNTSQTILISQIIKKKTREKTRSLTYSTDLENSVCKRFIISLRLSHTVVNTSQTILISQIIQKPNVKLNL